MGEEKLQKDIDDLYEKTNGIEKKLVEMETNQKHYTDTLEKVADSNIKLIDTLQSMQITFVKMDNKIDEISKDTAETKKQVTGIDCRMKKIEDDNTFNIMQFLKKYFPLIVVGIGVIGLLASPYIKF